MKAAKSGFIYFYYNLNNNYREAKLCHRPAGQSVVNMQAERGDVVTVHPFLKTVILFDFLVIKTLKKFGLEHREHSAKTVTSNRTVTDPANMMISGFANQ